MAEYYYYAAAEKPEPWRLRHGLLLAVTVVTTLFAGTTFLSRFADLGIFEHVALMVHHPVLLLLGTPFALPLLFILGIHEMGHFLTARRYGIRVTWPYFLPGPPFISLGTFGAFIRLKGVIPTRGALMEVGANGPFWGFGASVLVAVAGFAMGAFGFRMPTDLGINVHLPLAYWFIQGVFTNRWSHSLTFFSNPVLLAAWIGFFVQGLNLLPIGQLDGGHVLYAFAGRKHRIVSFALAFLFLAFAIYHPQWLLWVALIFFVLGLRHPPCMDDGPALSGRQTALGLFSVFIFVVSFLPVPFA